MSYIIWNGKRSTEIYGLIICELPPITKPKMKTSITKINGRDGDIIEEQGYESYTKTISIGLARNYDIDKVMKYFTGTGELILSNEPDKVYNSTIFDKIDYQKLINFKKATVKFYTQPFKYLKDENEIVVNCSVENNKVIHNVGLEIAKPIIKLEGSGTVELSINDINILKYTFPDGESEVIIDSLKEEAYLNSEYKNRNMNGVFPILDPGNNTITWTGNLTKIKIQPKSRWL